MTDLKSQRRLASQILKIGVNRVWIDPERAFDVEIAITREEVRKLISEGVISKRPDKGVSRARARAIHQKKKRGRRRGPGSRTSPRYAKISKKKAWMTKIRALRKRLRMLKTSRIITERTYRTAYTMSSSGRFESISEMERYLKTQKLWRER